MIWGEKRNEKCLKELNERLLLHNECSLLFCITLGRATRLVISLHVVGGGVAEPDHPTHKAEVRSEGFLTPPLFTTE